MDFAFVLRSLPLLLEGLQLTIALAGLALVGAALGGIVVAMARRSAFAPVRACRSPSSR